jgi:hypothetical protein
MSLFPEVDKEISEIKIELHKFTQNIIDEAEIYTPSNGSEGSMFIEFYCAQCPCDDGKNKLCEVLTHYAIHGSHRAIKIDKNGAFLCASSPMFKKLAEDKFYHKRKKQ